MAGVEKFVTACPDALFFARIKTAGGPKLQERGDG
jgi:hypothetical protein